MTFIFLSSAENLGLTQVTKYNCGLLISCSIPSLFYTSLSLYEWHMSAGNAIDRDLLAVFQVFSVRGLGWSFLQLAMACTLAAK